MNNLRPQVLSAAIIAVITLQCHIALAQFRVDAFQVDQKPQSGGGISYELSAGLSGYTSFGVPFGGVTLTAPDGVNYPLSSNPTTFNSFSELGSKLFGDWLVTEHPTSGSDRTYSIRIAAFGLANVFSETAEITSPIPGSPVPQDFVVKYIFPSGATPNSRILTYSRSSNLNVLSTQGGVDGTNSQGFHTQLLDSGPGSISIRTGISTGLPSPPIVNRSSSLIGQSIFTFLSFNAYSQSATYQVVPEPSALVLLGLGAISLLGYRLRKR